MNVLRASHFGVCVSDLERSITFYSQVLGFKEGSRLSLEDEATRRLLALPDARLEAVYLQRDGWTLELLYYPQPGAMRGAAPRPMNRTGLTHLSFQVAELEPMVDAVRAHGGRVLEETRVPRALFVLDPDGTRIELIAGDFDPATYDAP